jgi:hypothetical protein
VKLDFSILWFDDNEEWIDSLDTEELEKDISSWGFNPVIKMVSTPEDFNSESPFDEYDLIVVDRNLEGYENGQEFIKRIRDHAIFTEIIFYTAGNASDLWDGIRERELEGVFVSSRNDILPKITRVGHQSVRKVLDLENMRGIVMAEVGELDHLLGEILTLGVNSLPDDQRKDVFTRFCEKAKEQHAGEGKRIDEFHCAPEVEGMLAICDSNKRWENFNRLRKRHDKLKGVNNFGDYVQEVVHPRNFLAHGRPTKQAKGSFSFLFKGKEFLFDDDTSRGLRKTIQKYKIEFSGIVELLKDE